MSQRNRIIIAAVAVIALAAGYWKLALGPQRTESTKLAASIAAKQAAVNDARTKLATYEKARAAYRVNYATLLRLGKAVPQDDDTRSLLVQLDAAARQSGVDFRTLAVGAGAGAPAAATDTTGTGTGGGKTSTPPGAVSVGSAGFAAMPFTFTFRGDFSDLSGFFARLQRFVTTHNQKMSVTGRLLRLDSISLKPDQSGFPRLRADVTASSFLLPATEGLTAGGTPSGPAASSTGSGPATPSTTTNATISGVSR